MGKNFIGLSKRILLTGVAACAMMACMAVTSFAYGINGSTFTVGAANPTVTIPVTGAADNQITLVVRTAGDAWLTAPNDNVVYIDQVTGTAATTNITFTVDSKFLEDGAEYDIYVGGNGQTVTTAKLTVGEVTAPDTDTDTDTDSGNTGDVTVATFEANYDENFEDYFEDMKLVDVTLSSGNGEYAVKVDDSELLYSVEKGCYVGLVPAAATAADVVIDKNAIPESFYYGDVDYDPDVTDVTDLRDVVDGSDLLVMKVSTKNGVAPERYAASDVDASGSFDGTDLLFMKYFVAESRDSFPAAE